VLAAQSAEELRMYHQAGAPAGSPSSTMGALVARTSAQLQDVQVRSPPLAALVATRERALARV